jgi:hypothetical protein
MFPLTKRDEMLSVNRRRLKRLIPLRDRKTLRREVGVSAPPFELVYDQMMEE